MPGIITSTMRTEIKVRNAVWKCSNCGHEKSQEYPFGMQKVVAPEYCQNSLNAGPDKQKCPLRSYTLNLDKSDYFDN